MSTDLFGFSYYLLTCIKESNIHPSLQCQCFTCTRYNISSSDFTSPHLTSDLSDLGTPLKGPLSDLRFQHLISLIQLSDFSDVPDKSP